MIRGEGIQLTRSVHLAFALILLLFAGRAAALEKGALHVKVTLQDRLDRATVTIRAAADREGAIIDRKTASSGAQVTFQVPLRTPLVLSVRADGYEDVRIETTLTKPSAEHVIDMRLQPRVTITAPSGTRVLLDDRFIGTTAASGLVIKSPTIVAGRKYVVLLEGPNGRKSVPFVARAGNGIIVYGLRKSRGLVIGSKDYQIYPPPIPR